MVQVTPSVGRARRVVAGLFVASLVLVAASLAGGAWWLLR
jgi:hypothetical protein